jgi:hypothetical protein
MHIQVRCSESKIALLLRVWTLASKPARMPGGEFGTVPGTWDNDRGEGGHKRDSLFRENGADLGNMGGKTGAEANYGTTGVGKRRAWEARSAITRTGKSSLGTGDDKKLLH